MFRCLRLSKRSGERIARIIRRKFAAANLNLMEFTPVARERHSSVLICGTSLSMGSPHLPPVFLGAGIPIRPKISPPTKARGIEAHTKTLLKA
jgi:hypothetical protein